MMIEIGKKTHSDSVNKNVVCIPTHDLMREKLDKKKFCSEIFFFFFVKKREKIVYDENK